MTLDDIVRAITLVVLIVDMALVPFAIGQRTRPGRTWLLIVGVNLLLIGRAATSLSKFGEHVVWWGSPLALVAGLMLLVYGVITLVQEHAYRDCVRQRKRKR